MLEGGLLGALLLYGLPAGPTAAAVVIYHAIALWVPALGGTIGFARLRRTMAAGVIDAVGAAGLGGRAARRHPGAPGRRLMPPISPPERSADAMTRVAVVGHIEWVDFIPVAAFPRRGSVLHADSSFARAAGGGGVAAATLAELGAEVDFFLRARSGRARPGRRRPSSRSEASTSTSPGASSRRAGP